MTVRGGDSLGEGGFANVEHKTAQHDYKYWELELGLQLADDRNYGGAGDTLRTPTMVIDGRNSERRATWDWEEMATRDAFAWAQLKEPRSDAPKTGGRHQLGKMSQLALCAYLHGYGAGDLKNWRTLNLFDLGGTGETRILGEMAVFTLDRPMPGPIQKLDGHCR
jgi:hypothetical protein